eukprot:jgi/Bigna1/75900/fgenesh1_pg.37_\
MASAWRMGATALASLILIAVAFRDQFSSSVSTGRQVSGGCVGTRLIVNTKRSGLGSQKQMPASCSSFSRFGVLGATRSTLRFRGGGDDGRATFINCVNERKEEFSSYLSEAGANRASLERIIEEYAESHHDEVAFLLENMPKKHLREIPYEILASSITLSKRLREEAPWGGDVPLEIYLNDVLPYSCVTEPIEDWRPFLHAKFAQKASAPREMGGTRQNHVYACSDLHSPSESPDTKKKRKKKEEEEEEEEKLFRQ